MDTRGLGTLPPDYEELGSPKEEILETIARYDGEPVATKTVTGAPEIDVTNRTVYNHLHELASDDILSKHEIGGKLAWTLARRDPTATDVLEATKRLDDSDDLEPIAEAATSRLGERRVDAYDPDTETVNTLLEQMGPSDLQRVRGRLETLTDEQRPPPVRDYFWAAPGASVVVLLSSILFVGVGTIATILLALGGLSYAESGRSEPELLIFGGTALVAALVPLFVSILLFKRARRAVESNPGTSQESA